MSGGRCRGGNSANKSNVARATLWTAFSNASSVRAEAECTPLTLRTNWRAASAISCSVAAGCKPRSIVMLRHMGSMLRVARASDPLEPAGPAVRPRPVPRSRSELEGHDRSVSVLIHRRFFCWEIAIFISVPVNAGVLLFSVLFGKLHSCPDRVANTVRNFRGQTFLERICLAQLYTLLESRVTWVVLVTRDLRRVRFLIAGQDVAVGWGIVPWHVLVRRSPS